MEKKLTDIEVNGKKTMLFLNNIILLYYANKL